MERNEEEKQQWRTDDGVKCKLSSVCFLFDFSFSTFFSRLLVCSLAVCVSISIKLLNSILIAAFRKCSSQEREREKLLRQMCYERYNKKTQLNEIGWQVSTAAAPAPKLTKVMFKCRVPK